MFSVPLASGFRWRFRVAPLQAFAFPLALAVASLLAFGCSHLKPLDTSALDNAGMSFSSVQTLKGLDITNAEVPQVAEARQAGVTDDDCVSLVRLVRGRNEKFQIGDNVAQLLRAGISEPAVMQLAQLNQIASWSGEAVVMRLAGLSDQIILEAARRHAAGLAVLSGASLANFKNTGMREATLLQLVRRGVPDDEAPTILALRRRGWSEVQILRRYPGGH